MAAIFLCFEAIALLRHSRRDTGAFVGIGAVQNATKFCQVERCGRGNALPMAAARSVEQDALGCEALCASTPSGSDQSRGAGDPDDPNVPAPQGFRSEEPRKV